MKVSVCIPNYNRCESLLLVINDLLNQTDPDFELLIVDDASTDQTEDVVNSFVDERIHFVCNPQNLGLYPNFNRCIELAKGDYIAIYHNHDRYEPDIVEKSRKILDNNPNVGFVHTGTVVRVPGSFYDRNFIYKWPEVMEGRKFIRYLIKSWGSPVHQPTVMARRRLYEQVGYFDDKRYGACADSAIWLKMCMLSDVGYIPKTLMRVTPRVISDRYGKFDWKDVLGNAKAHRLGLNMLFPEQSSLQYKKESYLLQFRHDRYFLLLLAQCIANNWDELIQEGLNVLQEECSPTAQQFGNWMATFGGKNRYIFLFTSKIYGFSERFIGYLSSLYGKWISKQRLS